MYYSSTSETKAVLTAEKSKLGEGLRYIARTIDHAIRLVQCIIHQSSNVEFRNSKGWNRLHACI